MNFKNSFVFGAVVFITGASALLQQTNAATPNFTPVPVPNPDNELPNIIRPILPVSSEIQIDNVEFSPSTDGYSQQYQVEQAEYGEIFTFVLDYEAILKKYSSASSSNNLNISIQLPLDVKIVSFGSTAEVKCQAVQSKNIINCQQGLRKDYSSPQVSVYVRNMRDYKTASANIVTASVKFSYRNNMIKSVLSEKVLLKNRSSIVDLVVEKQVKFYDKSNKEVNACDLKNGQKYTAKAVLTNYGKLNSTKFEATWSQWMSGKKVVIKRFEHEALKAGVTSGNINLQYSFVYNSKNRNTLVLDVDTKNSIKEESETNNVGYGILECI
ncbi:hypothetical protein KBD45_01220 [Candidatus Dojkabacteria bacterium]|nr:hypothetical protein [Candidatus Dojkabacteria bacterium]